MKIAIIGRTEILLSTAEKLYSLGYEIPLVITAKEAPEYAVKADDFRKFADKAGAKFLLTPSLENEEVKNLILSLGTIDIAVSINFTGVISENIIGLFPLGILNSHGGDLPRYRGNACQAWAIINKETRVGLCVHKMIGGELDSGNIIARDYFNINLNSRVGEVYEWINQKSPELIVEAITELKKDSNYFLEKQSEDPAHSLRCYPRIPEDGKIDWKNNAEDIVRLINASSEPYSGAFTFFKEKKLIIWRARLLEDNEIYLAYPGQVASMDKSTGHMTVICGTGKISISEVEYDKTRTEPVNIIKSLRTRLV